MKSLLFGHGRKHRQQKSVDYTKSVFVDEDEKCQPDQLIDLIHDQWKPIDNEFDEAFMVCGKFYTNNILEICEISKNNPPREETSIDHRYRKLC